MSFASRKSRPLALSLLLATAALWAFLSSTTAAASSEGRLVLSDAFSGPAATVRTTVVTEGFAGDELWIAALAADVEDPEARLGVRLSVSQGWFATWSLQLAAPVGILPDDYIDGLDGGLAYINLASIGVQLGEAYTTTVSYSLTEGNLSLRVMDAANNEVAAANIAANAFPGPWTPAVTWMGPETVDVVSFETEASYERIGLPLPMQRDFRWRLVDAETGADVFRTAVYDDMALAARIAWPQTKIDGELRASFVHDQGEVPLFRAPWQAEGSLERFPPLDQLPKVDGLLRIQYVEGDRAHVIQDWPMSVLDNRVGMRIELHGRNYVTDPDWLGERLPRDPGITGRLHLQAERPLRSAPLRLEARFDPNGGDASQTFVVLETEVHAEANEAVTIPFSVSLPPQGGTLHVEATFDEAPTKIEVAGNVQQTPVFPAPIIPAFPGAEGFGAYTPGGRGGQVYVVTTLEDGGPGSLREAVEARGPRIVVFAVSGTIQLRQPLAIRNPYITIAGQTAPGEGITIAGYQTSISTHDVVVRHLRFRLGDAIRQEADALSIDRANRVIVDHVSASWSIDETLSVSESDNITVQWSYITESLSNSHHSKGAHGYGSLLRGSHGSKYSFHHNLWAHHQGRSPRPGNYNSVTQDPVGLLADFRNNVMYNWGGSHSGYNADTDAVSRYNFINNYYLMGPNSSRPVAFNESSLAAQAYFAGNYMNGQEPADPWSLVTGLKHADYKLSAPLLTAPVATEPAPVAFERVLAEGGAQPHDAVDRRIVDSVRNRTGRIIDSPSQVGGYPQLASDPSFVYVDSDGNGIPDWWHELHGFDPTEWLDPAGDLDGDGYTNIEEYINGTDPTVPDF